jgi:transcription elongation factor GreB
VSRAFVKEDRSESSGGDVAPERVMSRLPNYVTPHGLAQLSQQVEALLAAKVQASGIEDDDQRQEKISRIDRDLRYFQARLESAVLVDQSHLPQDQVHFGSKVTVADENGREQTYIIVGEDEADLAKGRVNWASPLARALMNARVGDVVIWNRPSGTMELEVLKIRNARLDEA